MNFKDLYPGFNGVYGWISIDEFDVIYPPRTFKEIGFILHKEFTYHDGSIFILIEKRV